MLSCFIRKIYCVKGGGHANKSVFWGLEVGRFNIAANGKDNCGFSTRQSQRNPNCIKFNQVSFLIDVIAFKEDTSFEKRNGQNRADYNGIT